jgi:hypothetical protein
MFRRQTVLTLAALAVLAGCNSTGPALPPTVPAKGVVKLAGGDPLREGRLELNPKDKDGVEAFADLRPDGSFIVTTYKANDGAVPGRYVVTISPYNYAARGGSPKPIAGASLPAKYLEATTSPLEVVIHAPDSDLQLRLDSH